MTMASEMRISAAPSTRTYRRSESVVFFKTRDEFGELSNMSSRFPLVINDVGIPSSEALYQACRFPHLPEVQRLIISQKSPMTAKMVSKPYRDQSREDWDDIRVAVMKWCLRVKLAQHWQTFGDVLLRSGERAIVEQSSKDPYWGAIPDNRAEILKGANVLGRLLMELRERLKKAPEALKTIDPPLVESFRLLGRDIGPVRSAVEPTVFAPTLALTQAPVISGTRVAASAKQSQKRATSKQTVKKQTAKKQPELGLSPSPTKPRTKKRDGRNYHVVSSPRGGWDVVREGNKRASAHCRTKSEAADRARELARNNRVELVLHSKSEARAKETSIQLSWLAA